MSSKVWGGMADNEMGGRRVGWHQTAGIRTIWVGPELGVCNFPSQCLGQGQLRTTWERGGLPLVGEELEVYRNKLKKAFNMAEEYGVQSKAGTIFLRSEQLWVAPLGYDHGEDQ
ncbi:hypothetical protein H634G_07879 [Metarhizium anisopliae BRIP 53293]|uniref:Uncharacterized protein n=1 Tax=Metarhizium anisopliae BRIP 53293 TaxID=1291518 RepID=A0A0D9NRZ8_METAN|nr:hypothetical protein H634G_07879 [Metarhizium anisopliae BRIP 53293]